MNRHEELYRAIHVPPEELASIYESVVEKFAQDTEDKETFRHLFALRAIGQYLYGDKWAEPLTTV